MKTVLFRTGSGSIPVQTPVVPGSTKVSAARTSIDKLFNGENKKKSCSSPVISLNLKVNRRSIRRTSSESDSIRSAFGSSSLPAVLPEEDFGNSEQDELEVLRSIGSLSLTEDRGSYAGDFPVNVIPIDGLGFSDGGIGKNTKFGAGGGSRDGGNTDPSKIGEYYKEMLKSDPMNSLLLRNYGKYLHEVERDFVKAEECYGRAILASPGDGEVLSLYGKLVWETQRDENRAKSYFDQAVQASPDDCTVLGSYAHFMWEADEDEDEEVESERVAAAAAAGATMVAAY
ncbi:hypothetical protein FXO38_15974 [Capsicum annuum]|uniref:uncharacterized protein LOC107870776 n=1 Tax=Capsicum annuum TaxID=4072 RepID=UPI0007BF530D|nr:uncharacterized protein LOC107870776 [Capsicum annuum]KAF3652687.1 hypothetical protein FXO38_15974 [Capsicum annuum]KAF3677308.1 hypothetical protein FXO37_04884 [Capsicum annuum]